MVVGLVSSIVFFVRVPAIGFFQNLAAAANVSSSGPQRSIPLVTETAAQGRKRAVYAKWAIDLVGDS